MDDRRFDRWTRAIAASASRRRTLFALFAALTHGRLSPDATAGPGCKNVGARCKRPGQCCSGLCKGKKGRKKCKGHDSGGCKPGTIPFSCGGVEVACTTSSGLAGACATTTGKGGYCFSNVLPPQCTRDADCQELYGPRAACVTCPTMGPPGTLCAVPSPVHL